MKVIELESEINTLSSVKIVIHYLTCINSFLESKSDEFQYSLNIISFKTQFWRQHYGAKETFYSVVGMKRI